MGSFDQHFSSSSFTWSVHTIWAPGINFKGQDPGHRWPWWLSLCFVYSIDSPGSYSHVSLGFELFHVIARHDCTGSIQRLRSSTSEISKGNVLGYYRNLGSLRNGNEYCIPGCFELHASVAFFEEIGYAVPCHWFIFIAQHEPMDVQLHCVIEKRLQLKRKKWVFLIQRLRRSTRSHISGNRGYDSNRVYFLYFHLFKWFYIFTGVTLSRSI